MSTKIILQYPYNKLWRFGYLIVNRDNRRTVILFNNKTDRSSTQYARYLMAVNLKRFLNDDETVDHINNDKTDDRIENLQILSKTENIIKACKKPDVKLTCPICNTVFYKTLTQLRGKKSRAKDNLIACSRICGGKLGYLTRNKS